MGLQYKSYDDISVILGSVNNFARKIDSNNIRCAPQLQCIYVWPIQLSGMNKASICILANSLFSIVKAK